MVCDNTEAKCGFILSANSVVFMSNVQCQLSVSNLNAFSKISCFSKVKRSDKFAKRVEILKNIVHQAGLLRFLQSLEFVSCSIIPDRREPIVIDSSTSSPLLYYESCCTRNRGLKEVPQELESQGATYKLSLVVSENDILFFKFKHCK